MRTRSQVRIFLFFKIIARPENGYCELQWPVREAMQRIADIFDSTEIWVIGGVVGLSLVLPDILLPAALLGMIFMAVRLAARRFRRTPVDLFVAGMFILSACSIFVSAKPELTAPQVYRTWTGIGLFYALFHWGKTESRLRNLGWVFLAAAVGLSFFSFISVEWNQEKLPFISLDLYEQFSVLVNDSVNPNVLAGSLLIFGVLIVQALLWARLRERSVFWLLNAVSIPLVGGVLLLTQSRGGLMAFGLGLFILVSLRWRYGWLSWLVIVGVAGWAVSLFELPQILDLAFGGQQFQGLSGRTAIWTRGRYILTDFPLTGVGMGMFWDIVSRIYPLGFEDGRVIHHAHNLFLQVGVDLGFPGLVAWLGIYLSAIWAGVRTIRLAKRDGPAWLEGLAAGLLTALVAAGVHGVFDSVLWGMVRTAPLLWAVWGLTFSVHQFAESA